MYLFEYLLPILNTSIRTDTTLLAIITPYAAQVRILIVLFEKILKNKPESEKKRIRNLVEINTVDSFQGK
jgi:superfamily I DNA and/or RNA helicase